MTRWTTAGLRVGCAGVLLLLCAPLATANFTGPVVSVLDGDTIEVLHNTYPECIQLSGIDCPEKGQPYGNAYGPPFGPTLTYRSDPLKEGRSFSCNFSGYPRVRMVVQAQKK